MELNIKEFMGVLDEVKGCYTNRVFLNEEKTAYQDFDIRVFSSGEFQVKGKLLPICELCDKLHDKYIGTSDINEPKFCFNHYAEINKDSKFISNL